jgi:hypothetical protein
MLIEREQLLPLAEEGFDLAQTEAVSPIVLISRNAAA